MAIVLLMIADHRARVLRFRMSCKCLEFFSQMQAHANFCEVVLSTFDRAPQQGFTASESHQTRSCQNMPARLAYMASCSCPVITQAFIRHANKIGRMLSLTKTVACSHSPIASCHCPFIEKQAPLWYSAFACPGFLASTALKSASAQTGNVCGWNTDRNMCTHTTWLAFPHNLHLLNRYTT